MPLSAAAKFISFEGTEGVGKTTAIDGLCKRLAAHNIAFIKTREPGGSDFAERLRALLIDPDITINHETELLLMFAARSDHLQQVILPALAAGKWVICDRFIDSTVAYQGYGRWHGEAKKLDTIDILIERFVPRLPDMTLWLDLPVTEGMRRAIIRSEADRFEQEAAAFFLRVHQGFEQQCQTYPDRIHRIDASGEITQVAQRIWQAVHDKR